MKEKNMCRQVVENGVWRIKKINELHQHFGKLEY